MAKIKTSIIEMLANSPYPVNLTHLFKPKQLSDAVKHLVQLTIDKKLPGIITRSNQFLPYQYLRQEIQQELETTGQIDLIELLQQYHPINARQFLQFVTNLIDDSGINVVWDFEHRKCYLPDGAIMELKLVLNRFKPNRIIRWDHLIRTLKWPENLLEDSLDILAAREEFIGALDGNILYDLGDIRDELLTEREDALDIFRHVVTKIHDDQRKIPTFWIRRLFQIDNNELKRILRRSWPTVQHPPYIFTENDKFLRSIAIVLQEALVLLFAYRSMPLEFFQTKLELNNDGLDTTLKFLQKIIPSIKIREHQIFCPPPRHVLEDGFQLSIEGMTTLKKHELLTILIPFIKVQGYLPVTVNENKIKGIKQLTIYCQICNDSHENPTIFHECMNCQRQTCQACYERQPQRSCVYCSNIADFILDLPRYCDDCDVFYLSSTAFIEDTESCVFCDAQLTRVQQDIYRIEKFRPTKGMISTLITMILEKSQNTSRIPLKEIINAMNSQDERVIYLLENAIALGQIDGFIDPHDAILNVESGKETLTCAQCGDSIKSKEIIACNSRQHLFCKDCYDNFQLVGLDSCPDCGEELIIR